MLASRPCRASALRRPLLAVAVLGLATACGGANSPGIAVTNAQTDVVFGGAPTPSAAATAAPQPSTFLPGLPGLGTLPPPQGFNNPPPFSFPDEQNTPVRTEICPGPPLYATAPTAATTAVQGQPKPGFYLWQLIRSEDLGSGVVSRSAKYTNYEVRNVSSTSETPNPQGGVTTTFSYDQVAPIGKGHTITTTFQVKQNAPNASVSTGNVGQPTRVSQPDAGVAIAKQVERDSAGKVVGSFSPSTAVLVLPLPIQAGATFNGTGTDPTTGGSMTVRGTIKGPDRLTGCHEYVQGYRVDASVTSSATRGQAGPTVNEIFNIQTQAGGLMVGTVQTPTDSKITTSSIVGSTTPTKRAQSIPKDQQP